MARSADEALKQYEKLPQEVKSLLYSPEMTFIVQQVGQKYKLHLDQIDFLNTETGQVMLGFVPVEDFANELASNLGVPQEQANGIAKDMSDLLFSKIRAAMKLPSAQPVTPAPATEKSVVMPSRAAVAPVQPTATTPAPAATKPAAPKPAIVPQVSVATQKMLTEPTVQIAPGSQLPASSNSSEPPKPNTPYKTDPYREPAE
jgi:hypothetical protein